MDLDLKFKFWGVTIGANDKFATTLPSPYLLHLSSATFSKTIGDDRNTVSVMIGGVSATLCNLIPEKCENVSFDLVFPSNDPITFSNNGPSEISLAGFLQPTGEESSDSELDGEMPEISDSRIKQKVSFAAEIDESDSSEKNIVTPKSKKRTSHEKPGSLESSAKKPKHKGNKTDETKSRPPTPFHKEKHSESQKSSIKKQALFSNESKKEKITGSDGHKKVKTPTKHTIKSKSDESLDKVKTPSKTPSKSTETPTSEINKTPKSKQKSVKTSQNGVKPDNTLNKSHSGRKWTVQNGVKYFDLEKGTGEEVKSGDNLRVNYAAKIPDGTIVDSVVDISKPFSFKLGKGEVIKGLDLGMKGMNRGGKRKLSIPADLAYGKNGSDKVPPNTNISYTIKVLDE